MKILIDYREKVIRLTDERLNHLLDHPELIPIQEYMETVLMNPEFVVQSSCDIDTMLYYRWYHDTPVGEKYFCVVVKDTETSPFIITAYLTDRIKKGTLIWSPNQ